MALVKVKSGTTPRALHIMAAIANVARTYGGVGDVMITAGTNGRHMKGSRHYSGDALDVRSKTFPSEAEKQGFVSAVLARLGPGYEGILEDSSTPNEHFHFEYDPK